MIAITSAPRLYCESSEASGRFTLMMISASFSASALTVAPAAVNSVSGSPDLMPAPGSTAMSTPSALNFFTVSGDAATRGSDGSISLATAIFIRPPAAQGTRVRDLTHIPRNEYRICDRDAQSIGRRVAGRQRREGSGQEDRHQADNDDNSGGAVLHQH